MALLNAPKNLEKVIIEPLTSDSKGLGLINNRFYFYTNVNTQSALNTNQRLRQLMQECLSYKITNEGIPTPPIHLHISSFGGSIFDGISIMDTVLKISERIPVISIIDGYCASAATFFSVTATRRKINKHAYMLIHQLSSVYWGKYNEIKDDIKNLDVLMKMIKNLYIEYTKIPKSKLDEMLRHDLWLDSAKCLKYGLVDEII